MVNRATKKSINPGFGALHFRWDTPRLARFGKFLGVLNIDGEGSEEDGTRHIVILPVLRKLNL